MAQKVDLIAKKRDGHEFTQEEIRYLIQCVTDGDLEQCQLGALLMAVFLKGMSKEETVHLTHAMMDSGLSFTWPPEWAGDIVDKHSTGGVGDKVSLILTPALAACGLKVPMITGRGLGFSGGTLDKLESVPGFTVSCDMDWIERCITTVGCCIAGQTEDIVPADRVIYACRGITATVECIPLIVGSIISKKAVEKPAALVLDIKFGKAAFMNDYEKAKLLAENLVAVAKLLGISTTAVVSTMNHPIGHYIGNALEVAESIYALQGNIDDDLKELVVTLGGHLLLMTNKVSTLKDGEHLIWSKIEDGSALLKFQELLIQQGVAEHMAKELCRADSDVWTVLPKAAFQTPFKYEGQSGYIQEINARNLADVCLYLGTGRINQKDQISYSGGLQLLCHVGSYISNGDPWILVHHNKPLNSSVEAKVNSSIVVADEPTPLLSLKRIVATVT